MNIYSPAIDEETGAVIFPPIRQDNTEIYEHNLVQALDELNFGNYANQPIQILLFGTNEDKSFDLEEAEYDDKHFSHKLIRDASKDSSYKPDFIENRKDTTYGTATLFHFTEEKTGKYLYEHDIQISYILSNSEDSSIVYGEGELDEYTLPWNIPYNTMYDLLISHYIDPEAHSNINPKWLVRQPNYYYKVGDVVWPTMTSSPNYYILKAIESGYSGDEINIDINKEGEGELSEFSMPYNIPKYTTNNVIENHLIDENAHSNINPKWLLRQAYGVYVENDIVWPNSKSQPNYLVLEADNTGIAGPEKVLEI